MASDILGNPGKVVCAVKNLWAKYKKGIWIGKRNLGQNPFGLSLAPGFDISHWAVMINGVIY